MTGGTELDAHEASRLLELSRRARWSFPSSSGAPVRSGDDNEAVEQLVAEQQSVARAGRFLVEAGDVHAALELAAKHGDSG